MPLHLVKGPETPAATQGSQRSAAAWCAQLLFRALVEADGDAIVLHAGERPYLVAPTGAIELAASQLTAASLESLIDQLLPDIAKRALGASGLGHAECAVQENLPFERFTVAAARSLGDVRLELHRLRVPDEDHVPPFPSVARVDNAHERYEDLTLPSAEELWPAGD